MCLYFCYRVFKAVLFQTNQLTTPWNTEPYQRLQVSIYLHLLIALQLWSLCTPVYDKRPSARRFCLLSTTFFYVMSTLSLSHTHLAAAKVNTWVLVAVASLHSYCKYSRVRRGDTCSKCMGSLWYLHHTQSVQSIYRWVLNENVWI